MRCGNGSVLQSWAVFSIAQTSRQSSCNSVRGQSSRSITGHCQHDRTVHQSFYHGNCANQYITSLKKRKTHLFHLSLGNPRQWDLEQIALQLVPERRVYSVSELNASIRATLESEFPEVRVAGEISGLRLAPSGHCYF